MTATTVKSTEITNGEATPVTAIDRRVLSSEFKISKGAIAAATTSIDEVADVILMCKVPSHAVIDGIYIKNDDLDSNGTPTLATDIGIYFSGDGTKQVLNAQASGDELDVDAYASADTTLQAANVTWTEVTNEAKNINGYAQEVWEDGGLSSDPGGYLYIGFKVTTVSATPVAGDILMKVEFAV